MMGSKFKNSRITQSSHVGVLEVPFVVREEAEHFRELVDLAIDFQQLRLLIADLQSGVDNQCWQEVIEYLKKLAYELVFRGVIANDPKRPFDLKGHEAH